jgi:hypothetical protein
MFANFAKDHMTGTTTSTGIKSMSAARRMPSSVQNVVESFLTSKTVSTISKGSTKLSLKQLINTWQLV